MSAPRRLAENPQIREIVKTISTSTAAACRVLYPERFKEPFSVSHHQIFQILDDETIQLAAIAAPRSWGKSSIVQLGFPSKRILCRQSRFIIPISCTDKQAKEKSNTLRQKLQTSRRVRQFFPPMKSSMDSQEWWKANNPFFDSSGNKVCEGTLVLPRSYGQQIRGFLNEDDRPDLGILDDLESPEGVLSEEQRSKVMSFIYEDVLGSFDTSSKTWRLIAIGTVLHEDSALVNLLEDPNWVGLRIELCDDDLNSNWVERFSNEDVKRIYDRFLSRGLIDAFYREYRNLPQSPSDAPLSGPYNYYDPQELQSEKQHIEYMVVVDPAKTSHEGSCDTAIVCVGFNRRKNRLYVVDMIADRLHPEMQIQKAVAMAQLWGAKVLGVEITGVNEYATWPWESYIIQNRCNIIFEPLAAKKGPSQYIPKNSSDHGKDARISAALVPALRQGLLFFNRDHQCTPKLLGQMSSFPRAKKKDLIDALAHVFGLLHKGERYLSGKELSSGKTSDTGWLDEKKEEESLRRLLKEAKAENATYAGTNNALRSVLRSFN